MFRTINTTMMKILKLKLVITWLYQNIETILQMVTLQIEKVFVINKNWKYCAVGICNRRPSWRKNCWNKLWKIISKDRQIKDYRDYLTNGKIRIIPLITGQTKIISLYKMSYFPKQYTLTKNKINVELDLSNHATKSDLKNAYSYIRFLLKIWFS